MVGSDTWGVTHGCVCPCATHTRYRPHYNSIATIPPTTHRFELPKEADLKTGKPPRMVRLDEEDKALAAYGYKEGMVLQFKDLGPQIGYRTGKGRDLCMSR